MALPIYLVDDEEAIRRSLKLMLALARHEVAAFESGPHFLAAIGALPVGCILLDVRMPDMDGLQVQRELVRRGILMPLVVMTGHGDIAVAAAALGAGADGFIEKPFDRARMLAAIGQASLRVNDPSAFRAAVDRAADSLARLSPIERTVLDGCMQGQTSPAAAVALGMTAADIQRARIDIVEKLGASGLTDAIRIAHLGRTCD